MRTKIIMAFSMLVAPAALMAQTAPVDPAQPAETPQTIPDQYPEATTPVDPAAPATTPEAQTPTPADDAAQPDSAEDEPGDRPR